MINYLRNLLNVFSTNHKSITQIDINGNTPLHTAALIGDYEQIQALLQTNINLNTQNNDKKTALELSIFSNEGTCYPKIAIWLLEKGALFISTEIDRKILQHLMQNEAWKLIELLVEKGLKLDQKDGSGRTLLHEAANTGNILFVKKLIACGSNPDAIDDMSLTPLHLAALKGHHLAIEALCRNNANLNCSDETGRTPLYIATHKGHISACTTLIKYGALIDKANKKNETPLTLLFEKIKNNNQSAKMCDIAIMLLEAGAKPQPLIHTWSFELTLQILKYNKSILLEKLIENFKFNINKTDISGNTPLHMITKANDAKFLLKYNADIQAKNNSELTPLFTASAQKRQEALEVLLENLNEQELHVYLYKPDTQENIMHFAKQNNHHNPFSKRLKSKISIQPIVLSTVEKSFYNIFKKCISHAEANTKKIIILLGEVHNEYGGYQLEVATLKAAERANINILFLELAQRNLNYTKDSDYMPLAYSARHRKFNIIGADINRSTDSNIKKFNTTPSGLMFRDLGISDTITQTNQHGIGIVGAFHLEGLIEKQHTKLDQSSFIIIPINTAYTFADRFKSEYFSNSEKIIQMNRDGFNIKQAWNVIHHWNGNINDNLSDVHSPKCK